MLEADEFIYWHTQYRASVQRMLEDQCSMTLYGEYRFAQGLLYALPVNETRININAEVERIQSIFQTQQAMVDDLERNAA